jgi:hypothetical protein
MNLCRLVGESAAQLLSKLGRIGMAVFLDRVPYRQGKDFFLGSCDRHAAVALAGYASAVDHLAGACHKYLEQFWKEIAGRRAPRRASIIGSGVSRQVEYWKVEDKSKDATIIPAP